MPYDEKHAEEIREAYLRDDSDLAVGCIIAIIGIALAMCAIIDALLKQGG